jgi:hypothetical protein
MYVCMYIYTHTHTHTHIYYIHTYIHTYIHAYRHIHIERRRLVRAAATAAENYRGNARQQRPVDSGEDEHEILFQCCVRCAR